MLYLVATPIGNLEDMTFRAVRVLKEASLIAAEDTRHTRKLLQHYQIDTPLISYHDHSSTQRIDNLLDRLAVGDVALVSDAGMPGLSDPGYRLVKAAVEAGIPISPIPGATAAVSALVTSGLPTDRFLFLGFPPRQQTARRAELSAVAQLTYTIVFYESPHRLVTLLQDAQELLGDRQVMVGREITKQFEELWRGSTAEAIAYFGAQDRIRGEITVVIAGASKQAGKWSEEEVIAAIQQALTAGKHRKKVAGDIATEAGWRKREVYQLSLKVDND